MRAMVMAGLVGVTGCAGTDAPPVVDGGATSQALHRLPRRAGERMPVTIYEFRSNVPEISARSATEMFVTALVESGQFAVQERSRLAQGVVREKQMNAAGQTTGRSGAKRLREARYVFEGTVSEANQSARAGRSAVSIGGAQIGTASNVDALGIDVRVVNAETGEVVDAVNVRKDLDSATHSVSGLSSLASTIFTMKHKPVPALTPDVSHEDSRKESVDAALRACIESAVAELGRRFQP